MVLEIGPNLVELINYHQAAIFILFIVFCVAIGLRRRPIEIPSKFSVELLQEKIFNEEE
jgi:hypothetical protein